MQNLMQFFMISFTYYKHTNLIDLLVKLRKYTRLKSFDKYCVITGVWYSGKRLENRKMGIPNKIGSKLPILNTNSDKF